MPESDEICEVVITGPDAGQLGDLTRALVKERLAACGQIVESIRSIHRWEGQLQESAEARVALHTRAGLIPALTAYVMENHPYDVPCVLALPVMGSTPAYREWVLAETVAPTAGRPIGFRPPPERIPGPVTGEPVTTEPVTTEPAR